MRPGPALSVLALLLCGALVAAPAARAEAPLELQDPASYERLEVHVTAVSGASVFIDRGRVDQVEAGDRVQLFPTSGPQVQAVVRAV